MGTDHEHGVSEAVEVFSTTRGFELEGVPLVAAFNPAFTVTAQGTMLAFTEGRLGSSHDDASKTVLMNRSTDLGRTWEGMRALTPSGCHFGPRPYCLEKDGREQICVLVAYSRYHLKQEYPDESVWHAMLNIDPAELDPRAVTVIVRLISEDDGETWSVDPLIGERDPLTPVEIGAPWAAFCDFTGTVETIRSGEHAGRRIVGIFAIGLTEMTAAPSDNMRDMGRLGSGVMYSDDGETWHLGQLLIDDRGTEAAAAPCGPDQQLVLLRRPLGFTHDDLMDIHCVVGYRHLHRSPDGGQSWSAPVFPEGLPYLKQDGRRYDHHCLPSLLAIDNTLLTAAPSATDPAKGAASRYEGIIGCSDDMGLTWQHKLIDDGAFSYATMGLAGERVGVIFSRGTHGEQGSLLRTFTVDWLRHA